MAGTAPPDNSAILMMLHGAVEEEHTDDDESDREQLYIPELDASSHGGESIHENLVLAKKPVPFDTFRYMHDHSSIYKLMELFDKNIVPLSIVGMFLNQCGNHLLHHLWTAMKRKVFFP